MKTGTKIAVGIGTGLVGLFAGFGIKSLMNRPKHTNAQITKHSACKHDGKCQKTQSQQNRIEDVKNFIDMDIYDDETGTTESWQFNKLKISDEFGGYVLGELVWNSNVCFPDDDSQQEFVDTPIGVFAWEPLVEGVNESGWKMISPESKRPDPLTYDKDGNLELGYICPKEYQVFYHDADILRQQHQDPVQKQTPDKENYVGAPPESKIILQDVNPEEQQEEVDAIIKATQEKSYKITDIVKERELNKGGIRKGNDIIELKPYTTKDTGYYDFVARAQEEYYYEMPSGYDD